jgi:hypothetical protein
VVGRGVAVAVVFGGGVRVGVGDGVATGVGDGVTVNVGSGRGVNVGLAETVGDGDGVAPVAPRSGAGRNARTAPPAMSAPIATTRRIAIVLPSQFDGCRRGGGGRRSGSWSIGSVRSVRSLIGVMLPRA